MHQVSGYNLNLFKKNLKKVELFMNFTRKEYLFHLKSFIQLFKNIELTLLTSECSIKKQMIVMNTCHQKSF